MRWHAIRLLILLVSFAGFAWPAMMLLHEAGHVVAAWLSGGTVQRVVWHPLAFSRTDVKPNPEPLLVVWCGPLVGAVAPLLVERVSTVIQLETRYLFRLFAGFCLIANGAYIGLGGFERLGDAGYMLRLGTPMWLLILTGMVMVPLGLWQWHLASFPLGSGGSLRRSLPTPHLIGMIGLAVGTDVLAILLSAFLG